MGEVGALLFVYLPPETRTDTSVHPVYQAKGINAARAEAIAAIRHSALDVFVYSGKIIGEGSIFYISAFLSIPMCADATGESMTAIMNRILILRTIRNPFTGSIPESRVPTL
uniref:hypothetical protein n=1 Tax=Enterocloster clostridioformis TaxID=1531 RepID=UPI001A9B3B38